MATTTACVLDALARFPQRLRGVAITDTRIKPETLRDWHKIGMRGLRFHLMAQKPGYVRGVGLDVFEVFRKTMAELGWVMQIFCDWQRDRRHGADAARDCARHAGDRRSLRHGRRRRAASTSRISRRCCGWSATATRTSRSRRRIACRSNIPTMPTRAPLHEALVRANPERLMWGTDWPHPSIAAEVMPDDGHLLDLLFDWTPDEAVRRRILVETPQRLFGI